MIAIISILAIALGIWRPSTSVCMGVELASASTLDRITASRQQSEALNVPILLDQTAIATDHESRTVYIPQPIHEDTTRADLIGTISVEPPYDLCWMKEDTFADLSGAVSNNHAFTMLVYDENVYARYRVIFTPLPVLRVEASDTYIDDEKTEVFTGSFTAFSASAPTVQSACGEWHIRGNSAVLQSKKSWRLSLKDGTGNQKNLSLAGLGSDDDWILNPMSRDDLKFREHFIGNLWNEINQDPHLSMSAGEYVELVMDGEYMGLYLLQRRVDRKYLSLHKNDLLMKGTNGNNQISAEDTFEEVYSPSGTQDAYAIAGTYYTNFTPEFIDLSNYINYELLINLFYLPDNLEWKNTFYLWRPNESNFSLSFIPWDTDMSLGFDYKEGILFNIYLRDEAKILHRQEYDALSALYPDLDRQIALGWQELRKSLISYEGLANQIRSLRADLQQSGALFRDYDRWEYYALGADTEDLLFGFLKGRIEQLDAYYGDILKQ